MIKVRIVTLSLFSDQEIGWKKRSCPSSKKSRTGIVYWYWNLFSYVFINNLRIKNLNYSYNINYECMDKNKVFSMNNLLFFYESPFLLLFTGHHVITFHWYFSLSLKVHWVSINKVRPMDLRSIWWDATRSRRQHHKSEDLPSWDPNL